TFTGTPTGYTIDPGSITGNEVQLSDTTSTSRTIFVDSSVAPTAVSGSLNTFRYRIRGTFYSAGSPRPTTDPAGADSISISFIAGTWSFTRDADTDTTTDLGDLHTSNGRPYIDVQLSPVNGGTVNLGTTAGNELTLMGAGAGTTISLVSATGTPLDLLN